MKLIRKVEVLEVSEDIYKVEQMERGSPEYMKIGNDLKAEPVKIHSEVVNGRIFYRYDQMTGKQTKFVIGATKEVQEAIQLPFEAFEDMGKRIEELVNENNKIIEENIRTEELLEKTIELYKEQLDKFLNCGIIRFALYKIQSFFNILKIS
jgi:hypothetical protein